MSEFVDTNILIYAHDGGAGKKHHQAADLLIRLAAEDEGCLSSQVLIEFYSVATRKLNRPSDEVEAAVNGFWSWQLHSPSFEDLLAAISTQRRYRISWWDALIVNSAIQLECEVLWSEDLSNGQRFGSLTVRNPFV